MYEYVIHQHEVNFLLFFFFVKNDVSQLWPEQPDVKTFAHCWKKTGH